MFFSCKQTLGSTEAVRRPEIVTRGLNENHPGTGSRPPPRRVAGSVPLETARQKGMGSAAVWRVCAATDSLATAQDVPEMANMQSNIWITIGVVSVLKYSD